MAGTRVSGVGKGEGSQTGNSAPLRAEGKIQPASSRLPDAAHEVEWSTHGGLGPEMPCGVRIVVGDDGRWSATGYDAPDPASGEVPPGAATELAETLETRWDALTAQPFTGACPTVYDGPEYTWRVRRLSAGSGAPGDTATVVRELASCTWDLEAGPAAAAPEEVRGVWMEMGFPARW